MKPNPIIHFMNTATNPAAEKVVCAICGAECVPSGCSTGYATTPDNKRICYKCADARQREELKDRSKPFCAYLSSDGQKVTTWTGGELMTVTSSKPCQLSRVSFTHDMKSFRSIRARDVHGGLWFGRGSAGIVIKLRPVKAKGLTMSEIRYRVTESGSHFFDRKTLRFFGVTMRNFSAGELRPDGLQYVYRSGGRAGSKTYLFDAKTAKLSTLTE